MPALSRVARRHADRDHTPDTKAIEGLSAAEVEMLTRHARYGCLSLVCRTANGERLPFILLPMRIRRGWIAPPAMQLIYCRDIADYVQCAGAIGRLLLRHGKISVLLDSNGPVPGLVGLYSESARPQIFQGPASAPPRRPDRHRTGAVRPVRAKLISANGRNPSIASAPGDRTGPAAASDRRSGSPARPWRNCRWRRFRRRAGNRHSSGSSRPP